MKKPEEMTTEELEQIIRDDCNSENTLPWEVLEPILAELSRRHRENNPNAPQTPPPFLGGEITTELAAEWFAWRAKNTPMPGARKMFEIAATACRKQIPTMVTHDATRPECHTCPSCKNVVDRSGTFITGQKVPLYYDYCEFCGQALKWEE